jgi:hypothetical protein
MIIIIHLLGENTGLIELRIIAMAEVEAEEAEVVEVEVEVVNNTWFKINYLI